jgi:hypothetical protein
MAREPLLNELRCELSGRFAITQGEVDLRRYKLHPLPSRYGGPQEAILSFFEANQGSYSNPEQEGEIVLSFLSLVLNCRIRKTGYRVNGLDISSQTPNRTRPVSLFAEPLALSSPEIAVSQLFTLGKQLTKQFIRACNAYSLALSSVELDSTLSFLLLVTALECIASQEEFCPNAELDKQRKSVERYCKLVLSYCEAVQELYPTGGEHAFVRELKTVYFSHRSGFVHAGKEVSVASRIADDSGFHSIAHFVEGNEVHTPGLKWFFRVVRSTLLGFLARYPRGSELSNEEVLSEIAKARAVITMRVGDP